MNNFEYLEGLSNEQIDDQIIWLNYEETEDSDYTVQVQEININSEAFGSSRTVTVNPPSISFDYA